MRRVSVPTNLVRKGDVLELPGDPRGPESFAVVTQVWQDEGGDVHAQSLRASGRSDEERCPAGSVPGMYSRIGEGCAPTPEGLRAWLRDNGLGDFGSSGV